MSTEFTCGFSRFGGAVLWRGRLARTSQHRRGEPHSELIRIPLAPLSAAGEAGRGWHEVPGEGLAQHQRASPHPPPCPLRVAIQPRAAQSRRYPNSPRVRLPRQRPVPRRQQPFPPPSCAPPQPSLSPADTIVGRPTAPIRKTRTSRSSLLFRGLGNGRIDGIGGPPKSAGSRAYDRAGFREAECNAPAAPRL